MEKQIKLIIFLLSILCLGFTQNSITTKEYTFYKKSNTNYIDVLDYIDNLEGQYLLTLINVSDHNYMLNKKILIKQCELEFTISSDIHDNEINVKKCSDKINYTDNVIINNYNSKIMFNAKNISSLTGIFTFWISGYFHNDNLLYDNNIENGVMKEWFDNGLPYIEYNFDHGKKHGIQKRWYENGVLSINYIFKNGKLHGEQKSWHENGKLKSIMFYNNDILDGIYKEWYLNGQLKSVKIYESGSLKNVLESYDISGKTNLNGF